VAVVFQHFSGDVPGDCHDGLFAGFGRFRQLRDGVVTQVAWSHSLQTRFFG
jgi:hypothetical protein